MTMPDPTPDPAVLSDARARLVAAELTKVQQSAIKGSIFLVGSWGLTTQYEDHPDIMDDLSEELADCVSGILTPLGLAVRNYLVQQESAHDQ